MAHTFYFDDNLSMTPVVRGLRVEKVAAVTADEASNRGADDAIHLDFCAARGFVIVTADLGDFSRLHWEWLAAGKSHAGIVLVRQRTSLGDQLRGLLRIEREVPPQELSNSLVYLSRFIESAS